MRVAELSAYLVRLELRKEIKHASHARRESENLVVRCTLADGTQGFGEGVPRPYVTGETPEGAMSQLAATPLGEQLSGDCGSWDEVFALCDRFTPAPVHEDPRGCHGNALRAAVEISILDAYARLFGQPLSAVTANVAAAAPVQASLAKVRYSGAITAESPRKEILSAIKMRAFGFAHCKVKVGMPQRDDAPRLRRIRRFLGPRMDVRLDANEAWRVDEVVRRVEPLLPYGVSCLEQPVAHEEVEGLADIRKRLNVPIMLDESLTSPVDAESAIRGGTCDLFNIRLSKCGGFLASLRLASMARAAGLGYQLGCHPGESAILSAAGRHWATSVADIRYLEGSYDRFLLRTRLSREDITFGYGGQAPALTRPGLGITIIEDALLKLTTRQATYRLN
ncbi:MAG: dipeptide epimerase [Planctomycetota bacterium]